MTGSANQIVRLRGNAQPQEVVDKTHPGFTLQCKNCLSVSCIVESDFEFSAEDGKYGSVYALCLKCNNKTVLFG